MNDRSELTEDELAAQEQGSGCGVCMITPDADGLIGLNRYDYGYLCLPTLPWGGKSEPPMFLSKDEVLPLMLALIMGLQHALAMVAGIATSGGLLIAGDACFAWQLDSEMCDAREYLVSAAWITSGILTCVQVFRAKFGNTGYYLGTGLVSVMGTSFTFLPIARDMVISEIRDAKAQGKCNGNDCRGFGREGYGKFLGTAMVAAWVEVIISFLPTKVRQKIFPPVVTGTAVMLIGGSLISSGIKYLGGGVFCAENDLSRSASFGSPQFCNENGNVVLPFGSPEYIGLGFSVIAMSIFLQFFGSPFLKSTFLFWGLMFGVIISATVTYEAKEGDFTIGDDGNVEPAQVGRQYKYWNDDRIKDAPKLIFLWDTTFPLRFAPEYFLPIVIGFFVSAAETVGDITMSCSASRLPAQGPDLEARIQGGLLADGLNSFLATLFTSPPNTTFSQNNGVIALTQCASRAAGFACAFWLILFGVVGKVGAAFSSIPICVVGGLVLQCFAMVFVSGMTIATKNINRRNSFILAIALALGLGVAMEPNLFEGGGGVSFFAQNLNHNFGFYPRHKTCKKFPRVTTTTVLADASCTVGDYSWTSDDVNFMEVCDSLGGTFTDAVTMTTNERVKTCTNSNGACCDKYYKRKKSNRTTVLLLLKTPYCIGFLSALLLHLTLPDDEEEDHVHAHADEYKDTVTAKAIENHPDSEDA